MRKAARVLSQADPKLAKVIQQVGPCKIERPTRWHVFEALSRSIVYQQLSGKAAGTIYQRFLKQFGHAGKPVARRIRVAHLDQLRAVGLSASKAKYIQGLANTDLPTVAELKVCSDEKIIAELTRAKGVGVWTAQMLLMFWLGREDVLPSNDLGIQKGLQVCYGLRKLPKPDRVVREGKRWHPYRTTASWYLWRAADTVLMT